MVKSAFIALSILLVGASPAAAEQNALSWLDGTWAGTGLTIGTPEPFEIELTCDVAQDSFRIKYPSLGCGGTWALLEGGDRIAYFQEKVEEGADACVDGGYVVVTLISDRFITYSFFYPDDQTLDSFSTLEKRDF